MSYNKKELINIYNTKYQREAKELLLGFRYFKLKDKYIYLFDQDYKNKKEKTEKDAMVLKLNKKGFIVLKDFHFKINGISFLLEKDKKWSFFDIYKDIQFKKSKHLAIISLELRFNEIELPYLRVGTEYFKKTIITDRDGINRLEIVGWKKDTLIDDYGKEVISEIPKYDNFCLNPNNTDYKEVLGKSYNQYNKMSHKSSKGKVKKKDIKWSLHLIKHVWGEQWKLGLIYMQVLYLHPKKILPILALVSSERETGKTTFGDWLNQIYGDNAAVINANNISSDFNSSYGTKSIVIIEETKFEKSTDLEKIKAIATQKKMMINSKFIREYSLPFYGKIVMLSNHEEKFVRIDEYENRYWVRKIPTLKGKANHNISADLVREIPAFLKYLEQMPDVDFSRSRMVFTQEEINTNILDKTKENSRSGVFKDITIYLEQEMSNNPQDEYLYFRHEGLHEKHFSRRGNVSVSYIKEVLQDEFHLKMDFITRKKLIGMTSDTTREGSTISSRCYKIKNKHFGQSDNQEDTEPINDNDDLPF